MSTSTLTMKSVRNLFCIGLIFIGTGCSKTQISPQWNVRVLDKSGTPMQNCSVYQDWLFFGLTSEQHEQKMTDAQGDVSFPSRSITINPINYMISNAVSHLNVHASFEPSANISISANGYKSTLIYFQNNKMMWDQNSVGKGGVKDDVINIVVQLKPLDAIDVAGRGDMKRAEQLLGQNPGAAKMRDSLGNTPLHEAMGRDPKDFEMAKYLINAGADVNARDEGGRTPLHQAARNGAVKTAALLISKGADVNAVLHDKSLAEDLFTPLHIVIGEPWDDTDRIQMIDLLVKNGANINAKAHFEETPLHLAAFLGTPAIVQELLVKGANPSARNSDGKTPLDMAKEFKKSENIKILESFSVNTK